MFGRLYQEKKKKEGNTYCINIAFICMKNISNYTYMQNITFMAFVTLRLFL
jgi:hypothetical protein